MKDLASTANLSIVDAHDDSFASYDGEDRVLTSLELQDKLRANKKEPHVNVKSGIPGIDYACEGFRDGELIIISGPTKHGKCHGKGTQIMMFNGTNKSVEDIVVGDLLMGDNSEPRRVTSTTIGYGEMYRVTDKYGECFTANIDHILCLQRTRVTNRKTDNLSGSVIEISIKDYLSQSKYMKHIQKAYRVPVEFTNQDVPIDPYFIGIWLGDGSSHELSFTTADTEIVNYIYGFASEFDLDVTIKDQGENNSKFYRLKEKEGYQKGRKGNVPIRTRLQKIFDDLNLFNNKHIPQIYKSNTREKRLSLLAGLIDTDGNTRRASTLGDGIEFTSKSKVLAEDVVWLCRSLGFTAACKKTIKSINTIGFTGTYYRVSINGPKSEIPCLLKRKVSKAYNHKKNILRSRFSISSIGYDNYYGFTIDGNGRYLLGDFTVTHNTLLAQTFTVNFAKQKEFPCWFSYEVPARQFLEQFPILPLFYLPQKNTAQDFNWFMNRCLEAYFKYNCRIFFIDHLHFLIDMARVGNPSLEIGAIVRRIKRFAVENDFVMFLLAHIRKSDGEDISYRDLRDSSFIAQDSDSVIMVKRTPKDGQNAAKARVEFHRRTGVMEYVVSLEKQHGLLRQLVKLEDEL